MLQIDPVLVASVLVALGTGYALGVATASRKRAVQPSPTPPNTSENSNTGVGADSQEPRPVKTFIGKPILAKTSVLKPEPGNSSLRTITIEVEIPEKIRIPMEKLPELVRLVEREEEPREPGPGERVERVMENFRKRIRELASEKIETTSFMEHPSNPWIDIVSKVSGLEFSGDGKRVYCPEHGWVNYIVTSDGRILCGYDYHILFDPNKPKQYPVKKIRKMNRELEETLRDIQELRSMAHMEPIPIKRRRNKEIRRGEEEPEEEYEEPVEEAKYGEEEDIEEREEYEEESEEE